MNDRAQQLEELLAETIARIRLPDEDVRAAATRAFDAKTKPRGRARA